jgi:PAS domain S-box-containing protein
MTTHRRRILIVDDNQAIHDDFRKILAPVEAGKALEATEAALFGSSEEDGVDTGFELDFAFQGQEALTKVCAAWNEGRPYMMAFVDVRMPPGWDGIETTSRIWEIDSYLQVVICTAYSDYSWKQVTTNLGQPDRFVILKKPFDIVEVLQLANALTEKWKLLHQAEERTRKLRAIEKNYVLLAEAMPCIVWTATSDGKLEYANKHLEELCGKPAQGSNGLGWVEFLHPEDRDLCLERWTQACRTGAEFTMQYRLKRASDGTYRRQLARAVSVRDDKGKIVKWIGTCTDVEDQKRAEESLEQLKAELEQRVAKSA